MANQHSQGGVKVKNALGGIQHTEKNAADRVSPWDQAVQSKAEICPICRMYQNIRAKIKHIACK